MGGRMSRFDEMCDALRAARNDWTEFERRSFSNMGLLVDGFIKYCEIPKGHFEFRRLNEEPKSGTLYSLPGAMHFGKDDYWHLGLIVTLFTAPNELPQQRVLIELCLTEKGGKTVVRPGVDGLARQLDLRNQSECIDFYDEIVERVNQVFAARPDY